MSTLHESEKVGQGSSKSFTYTVKVFYVGLVESGVARAAKTGVPRPTGGWRSCLAALHRSWALLSPQPEMATTEGVLWLV